MKLDDKDKEILRLIQKNAKLRAREIAIKLNMPITTVFAKIKRLEKIGIIKEYKAILDYKKLNKGATVFVLISYDKSSSVSQRKVAEEISKLPYVQEVHIITGDWDILVKIRGKDVEEIGKFVLDQIRGIKGVAKTLSSFVFQTVKETTDINFE
ncbi:MAG: Lrp/AsnC family transcriptional regulator [Candidatus Aenigmatarchaeota archaeon]|jgi:DNA-binding Lrp family transcriptional regulator